LPIGQPRRIFRSGMSRPTPKGLVMMLVAGLMVAGGVSLAMRPHRDAPPPPSPIATADELNAQPAEVAVVDGGTLKLGDRVVRLFGVEPPSRGTPCGTRDGAGQDCAAAAANALAAMLRDLPVTCRITGMDGLSRPYAICQANGAELNTAVIAAGWARADTAQPALKRAEQAAQAAHRGVWAFE
jgi:endonuclease YncB( thermonuclease family)